ncbi:MAG TPA: OmpA family protein, partial [Candidatus Eisenbacteria bacterium]|nr:OmpA family protein [Candidatus Eisenbacteria bacterium]
QCPNTPAGLKVDDKGCPIEVIEKETELLDTGMIRLENIHFDTDKWDVLPADTLRLTEVGAVLRNWPQLKIEIGGHTDSRGTAKHNDVLSQKRAGSVRDYLLHRFPELKLEQFTVKGYGKDRPIVPNTSAANMARNRRVEFVVMNRDVLRKEIEQRRLLKQGETAPGATPEMPNLTPPSPTPAPPDTTTKP